MNTKMMHLSSGDVYNNRKEAKQMMGHANFNRAMKNGLMLFINDSDLYSNSSLKNRYMVKRLCRTAKEFIENVTN